MGTSGIFPLVYNIARKMVIKNMVIIRFCTAVIFSMAPHSFLINWFFHKIRVRATFPWHALF